MAPLAEAGVAPKSGGHEIAWEFLDISNIRVRIRLGVKKASVESLQVRLQYISISANVAFFPDFRCGQGTRCGPVPPYGCNDSLPDRTVATDQLRCHPSVQQSRPASSPCRRRCRTGRFRLPSARLQSQ